jgi:hypothetical protein
MRPNGWLYKIILPAKGLILISSFYLGTVLVQFHPHANVTPDFQKKEKKKYIFKTREFYHRLQPADGATICAIDQGQNFKTFCTTSIAV